MALTVTLPCGPVPFAVTALEMSFLLFSIFLSPSCSIHCENSEFGYNVRVPQSVHWTLIDDMLSRFHTIPACYGRTDRWTDGRTDGRTDRIAISISRVSVLTRDKNWLTVHYIGLLLPISSHLVSELFRYKSYQRSNVTLCILILL